MLMLLLSVLFYISFAYDLDRTDFTKLLSLFIGLFLLCYKLMQFEKWNFKFLLTAGILFRLVFLLAEPNLSQDFYRFIWDGELVANGLNPYLYVPNTLIEQPDLVIANAKELFNGMGELSAKHFSNYPPLNQLIFALSAIVSGKTIFGSIAAMRIVIILADIGIVYFGRKLLLKLNLSQHLIFWYFINPLIIVELTGNLHFEGVMLFFFIWAMYLIASNKWMLAAPIFAFSISIKLVPLIFLPLFLKYFGLKKATLFYIIVGVTSLVLLAPFYASEFITHYSDTIGLWFTNFEFNSSFYNIIKHCAMAFDQQPWKIIQSFGKISPYLMIVMALLFTFLRDNKKLSTLITSMLWVLCIYYFLSTTVHPWYISFVVILCVFSKYRFPILWSAAVVLSYWAYSQPDFKENLLFLGLEYVVVFGFMVYEIIRLHKHKLLFQNSNGTT